MQHPVVATPETERSSMVLVLYSIIATKLDPNARSVGPSGKRIIEERSKEEEAIHGEVLSLLASLCWSVGESVER